MLQLKKYGLWVVVWNWIAIVPLCAQYTDLNKYKTFNRLEKQLIKTRIAFDTPDSTVYAHVLDKDAKIHVDLDKYYFWFRNGEIKKTKGGYDGKALHGQYTSFYFNKNLKEKGHFQKGLKHGQWVAWYLSGEMKYLYTWSFGIRSGKCKLFSEKGQWIATGKYKKGEKHGKWKYMDESGAVTEKYFTYGKEYIPKKSTFKLSQWFKKKPRTTVAKDTTKQPLLKRLFTAPKKVEKAKPNPTPSVPPAKSNP